MLMAYQTGSFFFNSLLLRGSMLVLIHPTLNLYTHRFTVDSVIKFSVLHTMHILVRISQPKTFSNVKKRITHRCSSFGKDVDIAAIIIFLVTM